MFSHRSIAFNSQSFGRFLLEKLYYQILSSIWDKDVVWEFNWLGSNSIPEIICIINIPFPLSFKRTVTKQHLITKTVYTFIIKTYIITPRLYQSASNPVIPLNLNFGKILSGAMYSGVPIETSDDFFAFLTIFYLLKSLMHRNPSASSPMASGVKSPWTILYLCR